MIGMVDYHTHSILSDGRDSYEEMVKVAIAKGLDEIGFATMFASNRLTGRFSWLIFP